MTQGEDTGGWFRSGADFPPPRGAAGRRWEVLSLLLSRRRAELEQLRKRARSLLDEIAALETQRRELTVLPAEAATVRKGRPSEPYWSPRPILGFRTWRPTPQGMRGVVQAWPEPQLEAFCPRGPGVPHDAPGCRCGIYAFKEAVALLDPRWAASAVPLVHGLVALRGKVVEHERGYRAQRAEVRAVAVLRLDGVVCGSEPAWIDALFASGEVPEGFADAGSRRVRNGDHQARVVQYLEGEARRFGKPWISENRSG